MIDIQHLNYLFGTILVFAEYTYFDNIAVHQIHNEYTEEWRLIIN